MKRRTRPTHSYLMGGNDILNGRFPILDRRSFLIALAACKIRKANQAFNAWRDEQVARKLDETEAQLVRLTGGKAIKRGEG